MSDFIAKKMQHFIIVAQKKSISHAAESICITYSPLIKSINELESRLGRKLFCKKEGRLEMTEFGASLYEVLLPIYQDLVNIESDIFLHKNNKNVTFFIDNQCPDIINYRFFSSGGNNTESINILQEELNEYSLARILFNNTNGVVVSLSEFTHSDLIDFLDITPVECCFAIPEKYKEQPISKVISVLPILQGASNKTKDMCSFSRVISNVLSEGEIIPRVIPCQFDIETRLRLISNGEYMGVFTCKAASFINYPGVSFECLDGGRFLVPYRVYFLKERYNKMEKTLARIN